MAMADGISIQGRFFVAIYEGSELIQYGETENKVLKQGLVYLLNGGSIGGLDTIRIGSGDGPTSYTQTGLESPLTNNSGQPFGDIPGLTAYEAGFINYFPVGYATGEWKEIGAGNSNIHLFNRAVLPFPVTKSPFQTAFAGVIFTVARVTDDV